MKDKYEKLYDYLQRKTQLEKDVFLNYCHYFKPKTLKRNEILLHQNTVCTFNIFVNKGCLRFYSHSEEGKELTRYFAFENKFGTSLTSLISQAPSNENIQAIEKSEVLIISRNDFYHLVKTIPEINFAYRDILEMAYITTTKRIYNFQGESALDRLRWLMRNQPLILTRLSNKMVASYLGITPYTLSRLKTEL
ncbi:CRP-like cAMP-binding protein [Saonia flava]|uniref:CRP-like cAMP-binding protein n=1 Tax=Saonia flava TaxID=523696 RepID=A0A846QT54_9FLAO|nr:Crp/Fnr family transcriptional regulator [Saonia flava]NJB71371.1 CRP-like cAMP-binding protein [Saonia flava]